mmetsp:Transcript_4495/g.15920  ORF Transcript_4495/g.15920 Transcript_4495/m.15920 type:complete len:200 (+) Transcript_4495:3297-3896(+)
MRREVVRRRALVFLPEQGALLAEVAAAVVVGGGENERPRPRRLRLRRRRRRRLVRSRARFLLAHERHVPPGADAAVRGPELGARHVHRAVVHQRRRRRVPRPGASAVLAARVAAGSIPAAVAAYSAAALPRAKELGRHLLLGRHLVELDPELEAQLVELRLGVRLAERGEELIALQVDGRHRAGSVARPGRLLPLFLSG